jgi:hypothetical protein
MSIGDDIKDALSEVGAAYTIVRDAGNISGEAGLLEYSAMLTKPITIEAFRRCKAPYDTQMITGDVVEFGVIDQKFIVTNLMAKIFENTIVNYDSVLYKCNIASGELHRPSGERWDDPLSQYHKETQWEIIKANCDAMQVAALYGNDLETNKEIALIGLQKNEVLLPHSVGARVLDRWQPYSGEYYQISTIDPRRYPNVDVLIIQEDRR